MTTGVQFRGTLSPNQTQRWFTFNWPADWDVAWMVVPTSPQPGAPELEWSVAVERASSTYVTYWITIHNLTGQTITLEARFVIFNIGGAAAPFDAAARALPAHQQRGLQGGPAPAFGAALAGKGTDAPYGAAIDAGGPPKEVLRA